MTGNDDEDLDSASNEPLTLQARKEGIRSPAYSLGTGLASRAAREREVPSAHLFPKKQHYLRWAAGDPVFLRCAQ